MRSIFTAIRTPILCLVTAFAGLAQQPAQQPQEPPAQPGPATPATEASKQLNEAIMSAPAAVDPKTFIIGPEDVLLIRVWREPEHSGVVVVRPDGMITLPLLGDIPAGGLTPEKLDEQITKALTKYINQPDVIVSVQAVRSRRFYVQGEVYRTSWFPLITPVTVMEALTMAGGLREFANKKNITIMRGDKRIKFNYNDFVKGKNLKQNIYIEPGDYIIVP